MSIHTDTQCYERWLGKQCTVDKAALKQKHKQMGEDAFVFLRATYYRWARKIEDWCPELRDAPHVLAIGDVPTENYGTWRTARARLAWGVNDFDEAASMPYVLDLVRLATSAALAPRRLLPANETCRAILDGYRMPGRPAPNAPGRAWGVDAQARGLHPKSLRRRLSREVLRVMGFDLAAIRAAHSKAAKIKADLKTRLRDWLTTASEKATEGFGVTSRGGDAVALSCA
jgi:uncharacterized protein (DUF2252 family)